MNNTTSRSIDWKRFRSDTWTAQSVGDAIEGVVVDLDVREGRNGDVPVITIEVEDGTRQDVWCGAADLKSQIALIAPEVGTYLKIVYVGERHVGKPSPMKIFELSTPRGGDDF